MRFLIFIFVYIYLLMFQVKYNLLKFECILQHFPSPASPAIPSTLIRGIHGSGRICRWFVWRNYYWMFSNHNKRRYSREPKLNLIIYYHSLSLFIHSFIHGVTVISSSYNFIIECVVCLDFVRYVYCLWCIENHFLILLRVLAWLALAYA